MSFDNEKTLRRAIKKMVNECDPVDTSEVSFAQQFARHHRCELDSSRRTMLNNAFNSLQRGKEIYVKTDNDGAIISVEKYDCSRAAEPSTATIESDLASRVELTPTLTAVPELAHLPIEQAAMIVHRALIDLVDNEQRIHANNQRHLIDQIDNQLKGKLSRDQIDSSLHMLLKFGFRENMKGRRTSARINVRPCVITPQMLAMYHSCPWADVTFRIEPQKDWVKPTNAGTDDSAGKDAARIRELEDSVAQLEQKLKRAQQAGSQIRDIALRSFD